MQSVVLEPVHLQEFLGHPDARQVCEDTKVAGHPKTCSGKGRRGWGSEPSSQELGWGWGTHQSLTELLHINRGLLVGKD